MTSRQSLSCIYIYILDVIVHDKAAIRLAVHFSMQNEISRDLDLALSRAGLCGRLPVMFFVYKPL